MFDSDSPIFQQLADHIAHQVLIGAYAEESPVPSTNEFASFYRINPATAGKAVNLLVDEGILYKKRGIGMFVAEGARSKLGAARRAAFVTAFVTPLVTEATSIGLDLAEVTQLIEQELKS